MTDTDADANTDATPGSGEVARTDVAFSATDGTVLRGWLYLPATAADGPVPGVVMTHGFSATRRMGLAGFAEAFAATGLAVLVYDHRNLGDSDGEPRGELDPWAQMLDMRVALGWLADRAEVDADRLGLWGSSFSAGEALCVAAVDRRVRAVVANVPFAGIGDAADLDPEVARARFEGIRAALEGTVSPAVEVTPEGPVVREPGSDVPGFLDDADSAEWFLGRGPDAGWANRFTMRYATDVVFDPAVCAPRLDGTPVLMVVATDDRVAATAVALDTYERASEPKQLEMVEGHHFCAYDGPQHQRAAAVTADFLGRHLG
ncbi:alpha/beta hydrolase [Rhabdothermincola salaria]|uniref:alpha/beta hydrolase n=1 Tax=Rhabdothermincola salaria TaxID=2903142 RepID=UPI001E4C0411|nr:alpha/beta hydrolase [Rhabdothermincola salaria]